MSDSQVKFLLDEREIPTHWVNLMADLPGDAPPPLHPGTQAARRPRRPGAAVPDGADPPGGLAPSPRSRSPSRCGRRTSCGDRRRYIARGASSASSTRPPTSTTSTRAARPAGSHKPNTAVAQAYENAAAGIRKLTTETGAGQWGSALAFACQLFGLECEVWMVGSSYDQKPYRRSMMQTWGATVHRSPSDVTEARARPARAHDGLARDRDLRGGRGRRAEARHELLARLGAQPRAAAPDGDRPGGARADGDGRRGARHRDRLRRRRLELRRADVPVPAPRDPRRGQDAVRRRRAGRLPDADARASTPTTSATPSG